MAWVEVPTSSLSGDDTDLPHVCVLSGREADGTTSFRLARTPGWTYVLLLFGILPFIVAMFFATERITIHLPVEREALAAVRRRRHRAIAAVVIGVAVGVVSAVVGSTVLLWSGIVAAVGGLLWLALGPNVPRWKPTGDVGRIELGWVHHVFAAAMHAQTVPAEP